LQEIILSKIFRLKLFHSQDRLEYTVQKNTSGLHLLNTKKHSKRAQCRH